MSDSQRLELTLRRRGQNVVTVELHADPEDHDELQRQLVELAREHDGRRGHGFPWQHEYELHVKSLDRAWLPEFDMPGKDLD